MNAQWALLASTACCTLFLGLFANGARADLPVRMDCYLQEAPVQCGDLERAFVESIPGLTRTSEGNVELEVQIQSAAVASGRRYAIAFEGTDADAPRFALTEEIPSTLSADETLLRLLALMHRGTVPFLELSAPGQTEDGQLRLTATTGEVTAETDDDTNWYVRPQIGGEMVNAGIQIAALEGEVEVNYSTAEHRLRLGTHASFRHLDLELSGDQRLTGSYWNAGAWTRLVRNIGGGFDAAILADAEHTPQNNLHLGTEAGLGIEWLHKPKLENDEGNVGVRYRLLGVYNRFVTDTTQGQSDLLYARHSAGAFVRLHQGKLDLSFSVGAGAPLHRHDLWNLGGETSVTLRVGDGFEVGISGSLNYRAGAIHEPLDTDQLDPVATLLSGSDFGTLTYQTQLSLSYAFGNSLLSTQDQRWR